MRQPIIRIIGQTGADLVPGWGEALTRITLTDNDGGDADELEIEFAVSPPFPPPPAEGTRYIPLYGWGAEALRNGGIFTFQSASLGGDAEGGYLMTIVARSADFVDADKSGETEHFDEMTAGDIFRSLAGAAGKSAMVHPSLDKIKLPYRLRYNQSALGFAQELADELGGTLKLAGGKWLVPKRGSGETASGVALPPIVIPFQEGMNFDLSSEGRSKFKDIEAPYFDIDQRIQRLAKAAGIGLAARYFALHPARSAEEAELLGKAAADSLARDTIAGSITVEGDVDAMAGAPVQLSGFGGWNGFDLVAPSIQHDFTFDDGGGWLMSVEIAARATS